MKFKNKYLIIISSLILFSAIFPDFWQVGITGIIGFFLAYLITKMNSDHEQ